MTETGGDDGHLDRARLVPIDHGAEDDVRVGVGGFLNDVRRLGDLVQGHVLSARDVDQDALRAVDRRVFQQRRGDGALRRFHRAMLALGDAGAHQRHAHAGHDGLDVGEVQVDLAGYRDQIGDALDRLAQDVVGHHERVAQRRAPLDRVQQLVVGDRDHGIHDLFEGGEPFVGDQASPPTLEREGQRHHGHDQRSGLPGQVGNDRAPTGAGSSAEAHGDEHHVRLGQRLDHLLGVFQRGAAPDLRVGPGTQALRQLGAQLELDRCAAGLQRLAVGVRRHEIHAGHPGGDHAVDRVPAAPADSDHLDVGRQRTGVVQGDSQRPWTPSGPLLSHRDHRIPPFLPERQTGCLSAFRKSPRSKL